MAGEERRRLTVVSFDVITTLRRISLILQILDSQSHHHSIQQPMSNLESSSSSTEDSGDSSNVSRLSFFRFVLEDNIAHFEDLDRKRVFTILSESLEESWEEGSTDDLIFYRFWVGENDGGLSVVGSVEEGEVLIA